MFMRGITLQKHLYNSRSFIKLMFARKNRANASNLLVCHCVFYGFTSDTPL